MSDIIELNGPVFELEKFERLNETDIFIQTSKSEGQSTGLLEAIGLGLPCLVTPGTNFGDIVEKYNFGYCADLEKVSISEKILESFYKKNELNKMSKNAIKYAIKNDCIVIAAVGNDGTKTMYYPAAYDNVIGVGSVSMEKKKSLFE